MCWSWAGARPQITSAPAAGHYGQSIAIGCATAPEIVRVALIRAGAVTHNFHMDQRYVGLEIAATDPDQLTAKLPPNSRIAPPGHYMLFVVDGDGIPSPAAMLKLS